MTPRRVPITQITLPTQPDLLFTLPDDAAHYVRDVLRLGAGDPIECFDGQTTLILAHLHTVDAQHVTARVHRKLEDALCESPLQLTLYQCPPKGERFEWILEKACELGVTHIVPVTSERTIVRIKPAKQEAKRARWEKILAAAARQCKRARIPTIDLPRSFSACTEALHSSADELHLIASPHHAARALHQLAGSARALSIWVGPEGGWTPQEVEALMLKGALPFTMGPRILRAETAAITALALAQAALGDLA